MNEFNAAPTLKASDEEIIKKFSLLSDFNELSNLLEISPKHLHYILFKKKPLYEKFSIPKKNGGKREILAPNKSLKIIQQKLNYIFSLYYEPKIPVQGFIKSRSVITNANKHLRKKNVLNFDIENFFSSINFGRVRGVLINYFKIEENIATVIANICCYENHLPQGAPTSPILSNVVCYRLDKSMQQLAKQHGCTYTRYADDLTFSTTKKKFPSTLAFHENNHFQLGERILIELQKNGFLVNQEKTRLSSIHNRLEVTGITVNQKLNLNRKYVRQIRAILRNIELNGLETAQEIFINKYEKKHLKKKIPNVMSVLQGKINYLKMVRGENDEIYGKLARRYNDIAKKEIFDIAKNQAELRKLYTYVIEVGPISNGEFHGFEQGTGFFLNGVGLVTNAHVIKIIKLMEFDIEGPYHIRIHRSRYDSRYIPAELVTYDEDKDIAILQVDGFKRNFGFNFNTHIESEQEIRLLGYPNHNVNDSLNVDQGRIRQFRYHYMPNTLNEETGCLGAKQERFTLSARIVSGNSGGPITNLNNEVIGVATKGFRNLTETNKDEDSEVSVGIKISDVIELFSQKKKKDVTS